MPSPEGLAQAQAWAQIDHRLVSLKIQQATSRPRRADRLPEAPRGNRHGQFVAWAAKSIARADKWAEEVYAIYLEVCDKQGLERTPALLRAILQRGLLLVIEARVSSAKFNIEITAKRTNLGVGLAAILNHLALEKARLTGRWRNRIEIEARELQLERKRVPADAPAHVKTSPHGIPGGAMPDAAFWPSLRAEFQALQAQEGPEKLRALYKPSGWGDGQQWDLGLGTEVVKARFILLATRAAVELGHTEEKSALVFWLDRLRSEGRPYFRAHSGELSEMSAESQVWVPVGEIVQLCQASSDYCLRCETEERRRKAVGSQPIVPAPAQSEPSGETGGKERKIEPLSECKGRQGQEGMAPMRPHDTFPQFLDCVASLAGREQLDVMSRGPGAEHLWMLGGLPTFREFATTAGREALREVWDNLPALRKQGKGAIQKMLASGWSGRFPEDNSGIIADGIWSCILLHGDRAAKGSAEEPSALAKRKSRTDRKGDPTLLAGKARVTFRTAEQYLGITERQRQNLVRQAVLAVEGQGQNRQITTESLRNYLPPTENPK